MSDYYILRLRRDENNYYAAIGNDVQLLGAPVNPEQQDPVFDLKGIPSYAAEGRRWARHPELHGIFTEYSEETELTSDALRIAQKVFYTQGEEAQFQLECRKPIDGTGVYEIYFVSDIDLSTFQPEFGKIKLATKAGGLDAVIKANLNVPYELRLKNDATYCYMDGVRLQGQYNWLVIEDTQPVMPSPFLSHTLLSAHTIDDGDFPVAITNSPTFNTMFGGTAAEANYYMEALQPMDVVLNLKQTVDYLFGASNNPEVRIKVEVYCGPESNPTLITHTIYTSSSVVKATTNTCIIDASTPTINMLKGYRLYMAYRFECTAGSEGDVTTMQFGNTEGKLSVSSKFRLPGSTVMGMRLWAACLELFYMVTGTYGSNFQSDFLSNQAIRVWDSKPWNDLFTCGDALRGFADPKASVTIAQMAKHLAVEYQMGLGIQGGKVRLEPLSFFYNPSFEICRIEAANVSNFRVVGDYSQRGNMLSIGQPDQDNQTLNGKDEPNGTVKWKLPFVRIQGEIDLVTDFRCDYTGIEALRANLTNKTTTDNLADKEVFIISMDDYYNINDTGQYGDNVPLFEKVYNLYRPNNAGNTEGIFATTTAYNLDKTPKLRMLRNGGRIAMMTYLRDGQKITFQTSKKNEHLTRTLPTGELIVESLGLMLPLKDYAPFTGIEPIYLPMLAQAELQVPNDFNELMNINPNGYVTIVQPDGTEIKSFPNRIGQLPAKRNSIEYEGQVLNGVDLSGVGYL